MTASHMTSSKRKTSPLAVRRFGQVAIVHDTRQTMRVMPGHPALAANSESSVG